MAALMQRWQQLITSSKDLSMKVVWFRQFSIDWNSLCRPNGDCSLWRSAIVVIVHFKPTKFSCFASKTHSNETKIDKQLCFRSAMTTTLARDATTDNLIVVNAPIQWNSFRLNLCLSIGNVPHSNNDDDDQCVCVIYVLLLLLLLLFFPSAVRRSVIALSFNQREIIASKRCALSKRNAKLSWIEIVQLNCHSNVARNRDFLLNSIKFVCWLIALIDVKLVEFCVVWQATETAALCIDFWLTSRRRGRCCVIATEISWKLWVISPD